MRSAVYHGREDLRVENISKPSPAANEVLIEVEIAGICGSDLHEYAGGPIAIPDDEPHPITGKTLPIVMGHEYGGRIVEIGSEVTGMSVGDEVAVNPVLWCGECRYCNAGKYHLCESIGFVGLAGSGGGFTEYATVNHHQAIPLPDGVPLELSALVEPFSVGLHAVRNSEFKAGDDVAVFGTGPIGLTIVQTLAAAGAGEIYAVEPREARRKLATKCGADVTLDPSAENELDLIAERSNGGVDATFEVAGVGATVRNAINAVKKDGSVTIVSIFEDSVNVDPNDIVYGERTVSGTLAFEAGPLSQQAFGPVLDMIADGSLDPATIVTDRIGLDAIVEDGFEELLDPSSDNVKILVEP